MFVDMAGLAGDAFRLKTLVRMAFVTGQRCMLSDQRKPRQIMIEKNLVFPGDRIVATVAFFAQPFAVRIIIGMAADTCDRRQFDFGGLFVAGLAQGNLMRALQGEVRHLVMIEFGVLPILVVVAFPAIGTVATFVAIILSVAADAGHRRRLDATICAVATATRSGGVRTQQGKAGFLGVIEFHILPVAWRVTTGAVSAAFTFVCVIFGMTGYAGFLRLTNGIVGTVATCASRASMLP